MNKSLITNIVSLIIVAAGFISPPDIKKHVLSIGLFAVSGAVTNWLAVYMLFEKVPGLYGSGVIPARFEEFKAGIRHLIMMQFFTKHNIERFFTTESQSTERINPEKIINAIDYQNLFTKLKEIVISSQFGAMLGMFGGEAALEPLREPFVAGFKKEITSFLSSKQFIETLNGSNNGNNLSDIIVQKVGSIVDQRLDELTPQKVKEIIQEMIRKHLGWLVVWGGVFGGVIGLLTSFL